MLIQPPFVVPLVYDIERTSCIHRIRTAEADSSLGETSCVAGTCQALNGYYNEPEANYRHWT